MATVASTFSVTIVASSDPNEVPQEEHREAIAGLL
jgi:hypothetical protein